MKTLVLLCVLVSVAIAAPALPGEGIEDTKRSQDWHIQAQSNLPDVVKREKKSPSDIVTSSILNTATTTTDVQNVHTIDSEAATHMGRSFTLKKPLIVKKKYGYRLYRDSEEEKAQADSHETCGRQVKVKLCDEDLKLQNGMSSSAHESINMSEDDVKHSIKMAKEAVENLQRDLKKMEQNSTMKVAHESKADTELHEDIEVARKALEHIHENFGNLESMSLHATTSRDSETMHDVHVIIAKTEEERMAQWKAAMENIQKNVEIARNIEDSFKAASHQESLIRLDQSESAAIQTEHKLEEKMDSHAALTAESLMRTMENEDLKIHHVKKEDGDEKLLSEVINEHITEHNARNEQNTENDMHTAASEVIESHLDENKKQETLRSEGEQKSAEVQGDQQINAQLKDLETKETIHNQFSDLNVDMLTDQSEHHISELPFMKTIEQEVETKIDTENDALFKTSENMPVTSRGGMNSHITSTNIIKPNSDVFNENQRSADLKKNDDETKEYLKHEKSAWETSDDMIDFLAKAEDPLTADHDKRIEEIGKIADGIKTEHEEHVTENWGMKPKEATQSVLVQTKDEEKFDHMPKSAQLMDFTNLHNIPEKSETIMLAKSADHAFLQEQQKQHMIEQEQLSNVETLPTMKSAEENLHHLDHMHMHNSHWAHEHRHLDHLSSMKAAEDFKKDVEMTHGHGHGVISEQIRDRLRNSHLAEHSQIPKMGIPHDFDLSSHVQPHHHQSARYHNQMKHSQMHEMSGMGAAMHPNFHPTMRDAMEGHGSEHMFRWKPVHESARVAYGSGLSNSVGSTDAVGVFPNANTGGCAIPLLLSCSPNVVSGSLAKAHSVGPASYSASSYRTEDEFGFHNKRDTKKTDLRTTNTLHTPNIVKQKSPILLESKL